MICVLVMRVRWLRVDGNGDRPDGPEEGLGPEEAICDQITPYL